MSRKKRLAIPAILCVYVASLSFFLWFVTGDLVTPVILAVGGGVMIGIGMSNDLPWSKDDND